jgi:transcriptional regulator with XRE-family HTH domain
MKTAIQGTIPTLKKVSLQDAESEMPIRLPNEVTKAIGQSVSRHRKAAGMSQETLAHEGEIERSRISKIETGRVNVSLMTLATICYCLKITLAELFVDIKVTMPPVAKGGVSRRLNYSGSVRNLAKKSPRKQTTSAAKLKAG